MQLRLGGAVLATALFALSAAPAAMAAREPLNAYRVADTAANKSKLALEGYDMVEADRGSYLEIYGTAKQAASLTQDGLAPKLIGKANQVTSQSADVPVGSDAAYNVWRRYDRVPGDTKEQYLELYDRLEGSSIVKKLKIGTTHMGRDIIALKVTQNAKTRTDNTRPAVLYNAMQHAREWLAGETCRRTLLYFTQNYDTTPDNPVEEEVTALVNTRELWFSCVSNPDGYEYTFTPGNRLWRKNMADNNGNGVRGEVVDGVDPNRNHATHWGLDNEGSSDSLISETYRGTGPDSEPETKAIKFLWNHVDFAFQKNDHTAAVAAAVAQRLPAVHAHARRQALRVLRGRRRQRGDRRQGAQRRRRVGDHGQPLRPGHRCRALHHQRRPDRRRLHRGHPGLHARGLPAGPPERLGLRVSGRRGRHRGRVPAPPAVLARPRAQRR